MAPYRLPDGTPVFHPVGEMLVDHDEDRVCCGICGRWFRGLATHVRLAHDTSADEYRAQFGLKAQRALQGPGVSEAQAARLRRQVKTDRRMQAGIRRGLALASSGELNELGRRADAQRGRALERQTRERTAGPPGRNAARGRLAGAARSARAGPWVHRRRGTSLAALCPRADACGRAGSGLGLRGGDRGLGAGSACNPAPAAARAPGAWPRDARPAAPREPRRL